MEVNLRRRRGLGVEETQPLLQNDANYREEDPYPPPPPTTINNNSASHSVYMFLCQMFAQFWEELRKRIFLAPAQATNLDNETIQKMTEFKNHVSVSFSAENVGHMDDLRRLWDIVYPKIKFPSEINSELWKKIGFQSDNPLRDFRGSGIFGLQNLLFLAEKYPKHFFRLLDIEERRPGEHYPLAVASFNITMMIFEILGWGWKNPGKSTAKDSLVFQRCTEFLFLEDFSVGKAEIIFHELYCIAMIKMDRKWYEMKAGYMDFPQVIAQAQGQFEILMRGFRSVEDLFGYIKMNPE